MKVQSICCRRCKTLLCQGAREKKGEKRREFYFLEKYIFEKCLQPLFDFLGIHGLKQACLTMTY